MKRTFIKMLPLVAAVLLATSCSKDSNDDNNVAIDPVETQNVASPDNDGVTIVPLTITVNKDGSSLSKASVDVTTGEDGKNTYKQKFIAGDVLVISNSDDFDVLTDDAIFTLKTINNEDNTATFEGSLSVKPGATLKKGTTKLNAVLKNTGSDESKQNSGQRVSGVKEVSSLAEGFEKYGYLTADNFTYNGNKTSIQLVQNTVFLHITLSSGKSNAIVNNKQYAVDGNGEIFLAVASGTEIESNLFSGKKIVTSDDGKVVKNIDRTSKQKDAFTINESGTQVYFSQGNLQYQASTNTWRFAEQQWDYVGDETSGTVYEHNMKCNNSLVSPSYNGWIDLFNWGTSGYNHGANCYQPWSTSVNDDDYYAYGIDTCNLYDKTGKADWGYNPISNGGNRENLWRVLTYDEWCYVLFERATRSDIRFAKAQINDIIGLVLLPNEWDDSVFELMMPNQGDADYENNIISAEIWEEVFQKAGAVFLPNAYNREGTTINSYGNGDYWSSKRKMDSDFAYDICIQRYSVGCSTFNGEVAQSVRLVRDI